ncbi:DUF2892 domain-containing protein [Ottowia sp.]|uniref:YgaP family membrane protein n=1 Tax=Ottowia sp. TaxID=1898956 RepID=UPI0026078CEF|nr:DUF2892 domain-containing protein [Ottowia sp.]
MQINVGSIDRLIRIVVGLALLSLPFWLDTSWRWFGLVGLMPLVTGMAGRCPGYRLLGLSTCPLRKPE